MNQLEGLKIDWTKDDWRIAADLGCTAYTVRTLRAAHGVPQKLPVYNADLDKRRRGIQQARQEKNIALWLSWDWRLPFSHIAKDHGMSRQRVHQIWNLLKKVCSQK